MRPVTCLTCLTLALAMTAAPSHAAFTTCMASPIIQDRKDQDCDLSRYYKGIFALSGARTEQTEGASRTVASASANGSAAWAVGTADHTLAEYAIVAFDDYGTREHAGYALFRAYLMADIQIQSETKGIAKADLTVNVTAAGRPVGSMYDKQISKDGVLTSSVSKTSLAFMVPFTSAQPLKLSFSNQAHALASDANPKSWGGVNALASGTFSFELVDVQSRNFLPLKYSYTAQYTVPGGQLAASASGSSAMRTQLAADIVASADVPEPASISLMGLGMLSLWRWRRPALHPARRPVHSGVPA